MNKDILQGNWKQLKGKVREQWGKLTDDELERVAGDKDQLIGKIQERYGYSRERAEQEIDRWEPEGYYVMASGVNTPRSEGDSTIATPSGITADLDGGRYSSAPSSFSTENSSANLSDTRPVRDTVDDAGDAASDGWLTTKTKAALLAAEGVPSMDISVETTDGVINLTGTVETDSERAKAEQCAREIEGARGVRNQIQVRSS